MHSQIIIDHASPAGFAQVAAAREYLLAKGRRPVLAQEDLTNRTESSPEISSGPGSHVVAPVRVSDVFILQPAAPKSVCSHFAVSS